MLKIHRFRQAALAVLAAITFATAAQAAAVTGFDDIQFWAGAGSSATNRAAIVIQWNLGAGPTYTPESIVWGFGWNSGTPTGWDALNAIVAADPRLALDKYPTFNAVFGMYYDVVNDGSGFTPGEPGDFGGSENGHANNPANDYQEGWTINGFWGYSIFGGNFTYDLFPGPGTGTYNVAGSSSYANVVWTSSPIGADTRQLVNGAWDGWTFAPGFSDQSLVAPTAAAVPEPGIVALLALGCIVVLTHVRKRRIHAD
jgi:hypothetical protein